MRLAALAIFGSLLINLAFGAILAGAYTSARPLMAAALACTHRHASGGAHKPAVGQYLAAVRMGWTVG
jgi:urea transporter